MAENIGDSSTVRDVMDDISARLRTDAEKMSANHAAARATVEAMHRAGQLNEAAVRRFASDHQLAETAVALTLLCGVESDIVERALLASGSDIMVILAKLAGFSWPTAKTILLLKSSDGSQATLDLTHAQASFERLEIGTARHVLGFYHKRAATN